MSNEHVFRLAAIVFIFAASGCEPASKRFEIHSGIYDDVSVNLSNSNGSSTPLHIILKVDTATGKTWKYYS